MRRLLLLLFLLVGSSLAVRPVSKNSHLKDEKTDIQIINRKENEDGIRKEAARVQVEKVKNQNEREDRFEDADSNNVNDQREEDLLKIKQLKTKFKDLFKKSSAPRREERQKRPSREVRDSKQKT